MACRAASCHPSWTLRAFEMGPGHGKSSSPIRWDHAEARMLCAEHHQKAIAEMDTGGSGRDSALSVKEPRTSAVVRADEAPSRHLPEAWTLEPVSVPTPRHAATPQVSTTRLGPRRGQPPGHGSWAAAVSEHLDTPKRRSSPSTFSMPPPGPSRVYSTKSAGRWPRSISSSSTRPSPRRC